MRRLLIIAGSDSGGGAGIQADMKTATCLGVFATTAITALTAQNTLGVQGILPVLPDFVTAQMTSILTDIGTDALKTGMLQSAAVIEAVMGTITTHAADVPLVVDPVMVAKGGAPLLERGAIHALKTQMLPRATVVTPNLPEAALLADMPVHTVTDMYTAGRKILTSGCQAVLMKGGHLAGETLVDVLLTPTTSLEITAVKQHTRHTHGTGCTYAAAIAAKLAQGLPLLDAVQQAHTFVQQAITHAPNIGGGHGPLGHRFFSGL